MSSTSPHHDRRRFLSQASLALASAGITTWPRLSSAAPATAKPIVQRTLGRTGLKLPIVSMGVMNANNPDLLKQAYEAGVRLFDTAQGYQGGRNEQMIGDVFSQMGVRDKVVIQTKIKFPRAAAGQLKTQFHNEFAGCLKRLQTSYADIILVHNPTVEQMNNPELVSALQELKQQKTARFIGVSQHTDMTGVLKNATETGIYDVVLISFNVTMRDDAAYMAAVKAAAAKGIGLMAMKTQTGGWAKDLAPYNHPAMLKWVLQHPEIATTVPGFTNSDQLAQSFAVASGLEYTAEEKAWLGNNKVQASLDFCRQCGSCLPTCAKGVDVPTLMRTHMYAANYANFDQARRTLDEIPEDASIGVCATCGTCTARCAHSVRIALRVHDLKAMYA